MTQKLERSESLISTARHKYEGRWLKPGDVFMATAGDADDMLAMGFATRVKVPAIERPQMHTADMTAETTAPTEGAAKPKRTYNRRDLVAER